MLSKQFLIALLGYNEFSAAQMVSRNDELGDDAAVAIQNCVVICWWNFCVIDFVFQSTGNHLCIYRLTRFWMRFCVSKKAAELWVYRSSAVSIEVNSPADHIQMCSSSFSFLQLQASSQFLLLLLSFFDVKLQLCNAHPCPTLLATVADQTCSRLALYNSSSRQLAKVRLEVPYTADGALCQLSLLSLPHLPLLQDRRALPLRFILIILFLFFGSFGVSHSFTIYISKKGAKVLWRVNVDYVWGFLAIYNGTLEVVAPADGQRWHCWKVACCLFLSSFF